MKLFFALLACLCIVCIVSSCNSDDNDRPKTPDVSGIPINLNINRFDQKMAAIDTNTVEAAVAALEAEFPEFSRIYFEKIIGLKDPKDSVGKYRAEVRKFLTDSSMRYMLDTIGKVYPDLNAEKREIEQGLRYFKHYFPNRPVPTTVYTMPSAYNFAAVFPTEDAIAVGLDMFLGKNYTVYEMLATTGQYPRFISRTFRRDYLVDRVFELLVGDVAGEPSGNRLLDYMVHNGKKLYVLDCFLPKTPDSIKLNYTTEQMSGIYANESFTWGRILKQNLIYSTSFQEFQKLVTPAPNAPVIAEEAPGGVGNFIGWQIVKQYMKRHPETTVEALMKLKDAQKLLDDSKYKPKK
ncbi:MAG: hypothetical protein U5L45_08100 [Saprospiraceae bacterium]|nr:hypothetical protein [Saprospiraceae bacterium]